MSYENPKQLEGINVSDDHPLRDLFLLLAAVTAISLVVVFLLSALAQRLAGYIPFETEVSIAQSLPDGWWLDDVRNDGEDQASDAHMARESYLRDLACRLAAAMDINEPMTVTIHYGDASTVNALATLGGHIVIYAGLANKLSSENAVAMVLAHEIAHVKLRHPIVASSRALTVTIALGTFFGLTDNDAAAQLVQWLGLTTALSFSRTQEHAADALAADALIALYGHLDGADELFQTFKRELAEDKLNASVQSIEFLNTHPDIDERIARLARRQAEHGVSGDVIPLAW